VLKLKYSNLDKDVSHAFLMEFKSPPICDVIPTCSARRGAVALRAPPRSRGRALFPASSPMPKVALTRSVPACVRPRAYAAQRAEVSTAPRSAVPSSSNRSLAQTARFQTSPSSPSRRMTTSTRTSHRGFPARSRSRMLGCIGWVAI
jgi:hypothetical protein